jgi:hypothetical protein
MPVHPLVKVAVAEPQSVNLSENHPASGLNDMLYDAQEKQVEQIHLALKLRALSYTHETVEICAFRTSVPVCSRHNYAPTVARCLRPCSDFDFELIILASCHYQIHFPTKQILR